MHHAIPRPWLRLRAEPPVNQRVIRVGLRPRELGRVPGHDGVIAIIDLVESAGLDDRDAGGAVLRETAGDGQAGISTANDDVVEGRIGPWDAERGAQEGLCLSIVPEVQLRLCRCGRGRGQEAYKGQLREQAHGSTSMARREQSRQLQLS